MSEIVAACPPGRPGPSSGWPARYPQDANQLPRAGCTTRCAILWYPSVASPDAGRVNVQIIWSSTSCVNVTSGPGRLQGNARARTATREEDDDQDEGRHPETTRKSVSHVTGLSSLETRGVTRYGLPCAPRTSRHPGYWDGSVAGLAVGSWITMFIQAIGPSRMKIKKYKINHGLESTSGLYIVDMLSRVMNRINVNMDSPSVS